ncbi:SDR family NAD(P)-dependent oxidoreductase [Nocardia aurea]|uniref:SDR family NAD(P)-dependent oxidoreductase n=1 Tax=Nocardia aurea TaxID=2144174 RepID=UPI000D69FF09|nr:SDR family NAD(P)-dependent oxidoreductase [Nocardia aurea]
MRTLDGRVAIVTGAAGGLGASIAERLSHDGAHVVALDRQPPVIPPDAITTLRCDVTDDNDIAAAVAATVLKFGTVDILVNNAGLLSGRDSLLTATPEQMMRFFDVNAVGALRLVQACFPYLRDSRFRGRVINVTSRTFFTGAPGQLAYVASKGALIGMTRVMARELGEHGITVNAVMPSQVATPGTREHSDHEDFARTMSQQSIREYVSPARFAGLVAFLASDDGALMTGQSVAYDGGGLLH